MSEKFRPMDRMATFITSVFIIEGYEFQLTDTQYDMPLFHKMLSTLFLKYCFCRSVLIVALRVVILIIYIFIGTRP